MIPVDLVGNCPPMAVGARAEAKALLDNPAGQRIEPGGSARPRDSAAGRLAVDLDGEGDAHAPSDAGISELSRVIRGQDSSGDQLDIAAVFVAAESLSSGSAASPDTRRRPAARAAARWRRSGSQSDNGSDGWRLARLRRPRRSARRLALGSRSNRGRMDGPAPPRCCNWNPRRAGRKRDFDQALDDLGRPGDGHPQPAEQRKPQGDLDSRNASQRPSALSRPNDPPMPSVSGHACARSAAQR